MSPQYVPPGLLDDLPRGQDAEQIGMPPHSHFESPKNLAATESLRFDPANPHSKLFLGVVNGQVREGERLPDGRPTRYVTGGSIIGLADDRHHFLAAGSRGHKGRASIIPILLTLPASTSAFILDPKGELARITAQYRAEVLGQQVVVLDPFDVSGPTTRPFRGALNVIRQLQRSDRRTFVPNARLIADSLIVSGDFKDRHWDECGKQILAGLCGHVATYDRYDGVRDLVTVWHLAAELATRDPDDPQRYWLEKELLNSDAAHGMIRNAARAFYDRTGGEFSSVLSNLRKHLDFLGIECMRDCLTGDGVDPRDIKRKSVALYSAVPAMRQHDLSGWQRLIFQQVAAAHEEETEQYGAATVAILEEMHSLGHLSILESAAAQFAGFGLKLFCVLQDLGQLQSRYPKSWETFIGNAGCLQVFSLNDQTTQEYVSKRLGDAPTITRSTNTPGFDQATQQAATGESWSLGVHRLLNAEEVGRFFARDDKKLRQLILRPGYRPAILQRAFYDKHELFRGRVR